MKQLLLTVIFMFSLFSHSQNFTSEFGYKILLPKNWAEYEDENNVDAFFDTSEWTGNLRISVLSAGKVGADKIIQDELNERKDYADRFTTLNGYSGVKYSEQESGETIYYWYLTVEEKLFICSFTVNPKFDDIDEIRKIEKTIFSIKSI